MADKFFGKVGYVHESVETVPGVHREQVVEIEYYGDVKRNSRQMQNGEKVNNDISVQNSIEVMADEYAFEHFFAIRYVEWAGTKWSVDDVTVVRPRLLLRLGEVYNGTKT